MTLPYEAHNNLGEFANDALATANVVTRGWDLAGAPRPGMEYYNTTSNTRKYWNGAAWMATGYGVSLDDAYDAGGAGAGRQITVDSGPVELNVGGIGPTYGLSIILPAESSAILLDNATTPILSALSPTIHGIFVDTNIDDTNSGTYRAFRATIDEVGLGNTSIQGVSVDLTALVTATQTQRRLFSATMDGSVGDMGGDTYGFHGDFNQAMSSAGSPTSFYGMSLDLQGMNIGASGAINLYGVRLLMDSIVTPENATRPTCFYMTVSANKMKAIHIDQALKDATEKDLVFLDIDVASVTAGQYFRGMYQDIDETVVGNNGSFIVGHQVSMTGFATGRADLTAYRAVFDGTKSGGDASYGLSVIATQTLNNAAELFVGAFIDLSGQTITDGVSDAMRMVLNSKSRGIYIDNATVDIATTNGKNVVFIDIDIGAIGYFDPPPVVRGMFINVDEDGNSSATNEYMGAEINITARATSDANIYGMKIYVDGAKSNNVGSAKLNALVVGPNPVTGLSLNHVAWSFNGIYIPLWVGGSSSGPINGILVELTNSGLVNNYRGIEIRGNYYPSTLLYLNQVTQSCSAKNMIVADVDLQQLNNIDAVAFNGMYMNIDETLDSTNDTYVYGHSVIITGRSSSRADLTGILIVLDGAKAGGDIERGLHVLSTQTINNANEKHYGIEIDHSGMTVTNGIATGIKVTAKAGQKAADLAGNVDVTGAGNWFRPPAMTTAQRNTMTGAWGAGDAGKMWYNTDTSQWEGWNGAAIVIIG